MRSANHPPAGARETLRERHFSVLTWRVLFLAVVPITIPCLAIVTLSALQPVPDTLDVAESDAVKARLLSREGIPLSVTYQHDWNVHDRLDLHQIPELLRISMLYAEDQRFYQHTGIDWLARAHAFAQNLVALRPLRGASTITEQVIRLLYPRPRTLWSRWLEGFEAQRLERRFSKSEIFEFYLNQVPYAANRRGVAQAARYFFDRSVDTLSLNEMFALAVMIRAPSRLDLWHDPDSIRTRVDILATRIRDAGVINQRQLDHVLVSTVELNRSFLEVDGVHFNRYVHMNLPEKVGKTVTTTLDAGLQVVAQDLLDRRLVDLTHRGVKNGAVLVVDHEHSAILAWCVARPSTDTPASDVNAVTVPRQPGSTLKPFVYAMALEKGWTAATSIEDAPLSESVGTGLHRYNNYSRLHYGPVSLREALASSLNIPAVKALQFVGQGAFLERLHRMGMESLTAHADQYGDGLALGNGEVSLLELVRAYTVLARGGLYAPLKAVADIHGPSRRVFSKPIASLVADILSDDQARGLEFGVGGVLDLPVQTAVKTGTSSDHRDVWAVGFNHRYTVGVWMGNLDRSPTDGVTGASGPAFVLRGIFAALNRTSAPRALYLSPQLIRKEACLVNGTSGCRWVSEWFLPGTEPAFESTTAPASEVFIRHPSNGLRLAMDPRSDDEDEQFRFALSDSADPYDHIEWVVDGTPVGTTSTPTYLWPLSRGHHIVEARLWWRGDEQPFATRPVWFVVR